MSTSQVNPFDSDAVAALDRQFALLAAHERPTLWQHATQPQFAGLRQWLTEELASFDDQLARRFLGRLRDANKYTDTLAELATGSIFREPGWTVEFDPQLGRLTPDLLVTDPQRRHLVVEVWRRGLPDVTDARNKGWIELARRIRRIPEPVAIAVSSKADTVVEPPDDQGRRRIEQGLRAWLASDDATSQAIDLEGLTFRVVGDSRTGQAQMLPVQDGASAHRQIVLEAIKRKVSKYRRTVEEMNLPFLVVLSADPQTGLNPDLVTSILAGNNTTSTVLPANSVGPISMGPIQLLQTHTPPVFDRALSGVAWLEINDGADAELDPYWVNEQATRPVLLQSPPE